MKKIKMFAVGVAMMMAGLVAVATPALAANCPEGTLHSGASIGSGNIKSIAQCNLPDEKDQPASVGLWDTIKNVIDWILAVLGIVAVIMVIIGGVNYLTSQGDPTKTKKGRDTILYGIIGLIIALLAYAIVNFVLDNVFNNSGSGAGNTSQTEG